MLMKAHMVQMELGDMKMEKNPEMMKKMKGEMKNEGQYIPV